MKDILAELETRRAQARLGGGPRRIDAPHAKGKLPARARRSDAIRLLQVEGEELPGIEGLAAYGPIFLERHKLHPFIAAAER